MLITLKLDCFHRKLSSYKYRMNTLTLKTFVVFYRDYYFICFELSTLGFQIRLMMTSSSTFVISGWAYLIIIDFRSFILFYLFILFYFIDFRYFYLKWLGLFVCFSSKTNLKKDLCTKIIYIIHSMQQIHGYGEWQNIG